MRLSLILASLLIHASLVFGQSTPPEGQPGSYPGAPGSGMQAPPAGAQTSAPSGQTGPRAQIAFAEPTHDFGEIKQGEKVTYTFVYTNKGTSPLVISNVQTTCGCTASQWSKAPIGPGKTGQITATFDSKGKVGRQNKVITVFSNAVNAEERIQIQTMVQPLPTGYEGPK